MELHTKVEVTVGNGAKVVLTDKQTQSVHDFIVNLLVVPTVKRAYRKRTKRHPFTEIEDGEILKLKELPKGKERTKGITRLVNLTRHSRKSIIARLYQLTHKTDDVVW